MSAAQKTKASDKQAICKKLVSILRKRYKAKIPKNDRSVLETILFAICLENTSVRQAESAFVRLEDEFHDLNEIRVSSITELESAFRGTEKPEWRALAVRSMLHYVFEKHFEFEFEAIRRKTLELASRQLSTIRHLSPFIRAYTLQQMLGTHMVPVDDCMCNAAIWLGLVEPGSTTEQVSDVLKPAIRKADAPLFCHLLRCLASDPRVKKTFDAANRQAPEEGYDVTSAPERLPELFVQADALAKKTAAKNKAAKKKPSKQSAARSRPRSTSGPKSADKKKPAKKRTAAGR